MLEISICVLVALLSGCNNDTCKKMLKNTENFDRYDEKNIQNFINENPKRFWRKNEDKKFRDSLEKIQRSEKVDPKTGTRYIEHIYIPYTLIFDLNNQKDSDLKINIIKNEELDTYFPKESIYSVLISEFKDYGFVGEKKAFRFDKKIVIYGFQIIPVKILYYGSFSGWLKSKDHNELYNFLKKKKKIIDFFKANIEKSKKPYSYEIQIDIQKIKWMSEKKYYYGKTRKLPFDILNDENYLITKKMFDLISEKAQKKQKYQQVLEYLNKKLMNVNEFYKEEGKKCQSILYQLNKD